MTDIPANVPEKGFYYHYKHEPTGELNNYAYEVIGVGLHTEVRDYAVIYRPLYKNGFLEPADYCMRPYDMFIGEVVKDGVSVPRFTKISDPKALAELEAIRGRMYP